MPIKRINEAIVGEYHFVSGPDYFAITLDGEEKVVITPEEFHEIVEWFMTDCQPAPVKKSWDKDMLTRLEGLHYPALNKPVTSGSTEAVYDPGDRKASQTTQAAGGPAVEAVVDLVASKGAVKSGKVVRTGVEAHVPLQEPQLKP